MRYQFRAKVAGGQLVLHAGPNQDGINAGQQLLHMLDSALLDSTGVRFRQLNHARFRNRRSYQPRDACHGSHRQLAGASVQRGI